MRQQCGGVVVGEAAGGLRTNSKYKFFFSYVCNFKKQGQHSSGHSQKAQEYGVLKKHPRHTTADSSPLPVFPHIHHFFGEVLETGKVSPWL